MCTFYRVDWEDGTESGFYSTLEYPPTLYKKYKKDMIVILLILLLVSLLRGSVEKSVTESLFDVYQTFATQTN